MSYPRTARDMRLDRFMNLKQLLALRLAVESGEMPPVQYRAPRYHDGRGWVVAGDDGTERTFDTWDEADDFMAAAGGG